jgi:hypothetical protein
MLSLTAGPDTRPYTAGFSEFTYLPARDGVPHGAIQRSSIHPNCSYFTNWTSTADVITWDIEVGHAGLYEAAIHYACPAADAGATLELSLQNSAIRRRIDQPHDPPVIGPSQDRAPRTESAVKDFKPLVLGDIRLEKTRGLLTLKALEIPGRHAPEIRYVSLLRKPTSPAH